MSTFKRLLRPLAALFVLTAAAWAAADQPGDRLGLTEAQKTLLNGVMAYNKARAAAQVATGKVPLPGEAMDLMKIGAYVARQVEVVTSINPLTIIPKDGGWKESKKKWSDWKSVGHAIADTMELRSIHETGMSDVGMAGDGPKRVFAELGYFYPPGGPLWQGATCSHTCEGPSLTRVHQNYGAANAKLLPKYAALNVYGRFSSVINDAQETEKYPLTFAYRHSVKNRMTLTSSDSLREWCHGSNFDRLDNYRGPNGAKIFTGRDACPGQPDAQPWNSGPVGVFDDGGTGQNLLHVLAIRGFVQKLKDHLDEPAKVLKSGLGKAPEKHEEGGTEYLEAQVHGPVRIERDIARAYANFFSLFGNPFFEKLYRKLVAANIEIVWYNRHINEKTADHVLVQRNWSSKEPKAIADAWAAARAAYAKALDEQQGYQFEKINNVKTGKPVNVQYLEQSETTQTMGSMMAWPVKSALWTALGAGGKMKKYTADEWALEYVTKSTKHVADAAAEGALKNKQKQLGLGEAEKMLQDAEALIRKQ